MTNFAELEEFRPRRTWRGAGCGPLQLRLLPPYLVLISHPHKTGCRAPVWRMQLSHIGHAIEYSESRRAADWRDRGCGSGSILFQGRLRPASAELWRNAMRRRDAWQPAGRVAGHMIDWSASKLHVINLIRHTTSWVCSVHSYTRVHRCYFRLLNLWTPRIRNK